MSNRHRGSPAATARAPHPVVPILAAAITIAVAAAATLAAVQLLPAAPRTMVGAPPGHATSPPATTPTPRATTPTPPVTTPTPPATAAATASPPATPVPGVRASLEPPGALSQALIPLSVPPSPRDLTSPQDEIARILAVSADGALIASVEEFGAPGSLHLTRRDGADLIVEVGEPGAPAPMAAAFAPDGEWLAVVSASGELWRVDVTDGRTSRISAGADGLVFGISLAFGPDGRLLVTQVASLEIPMPSRVAAVDPSSGAIEVLSEQVASYLPTPTTDGSILFFSTRADGTTEVRRLSGGTETVVAAIGETTWVDASPDGRHVVIERPNREIVLVEVASGRASIIDTGSRPEFAPLGDRLSVLDLRRRQARVLDLAGRELAVVPSHLVAWAVCPEGCDR